MPYVTLFCDVDGLDGLDELPIHSIEVIGVHGDDATAIGSVQEHFETREGVMAHLRRHKDSGPLEYIRGQGSRGDEIHAGIRSAQGWTTFYRIVGSRSGDA